MSARKPSEAERAVLLTFSAGLNPFDMGRTPRRALDDVIVACEWEGWLAPTFTPNWYEVTDAGREAVKR